MSAQEGVTHEPARASWGRGGGGGDLPDRSRGGPPRQHPHGFVKLEAGGKVWVVVLAPPSRMENRGLPRATLQPGAGATVVGYPNRTDPGELRAERITIGGKTTELR
jgi:hypothetical protein